MEGAKLVGEISTDWGSDENRDVISDRLASFTAAVDEDGDDDDELTG